MQIPKMTPTCPRLRRCSLPEQHQEVSRTGIRVRGCLSTSVRHTGLQLTRTHDLKSTAGITNPRDLRYNFNTVDHATILVELCG